jgi:DNA uptake protein ComE-like DNA-binding protein
VTNDVYDAIASRFRRAESQSSGRKPSGSATGLEGAEVKDAAVEALNLASREALIAVHGIGQVLADRIIENRPYERAYDVVEKGILPESTFLELRRALLDKSA